MQNRFMALTVLAVLMVLTAPSFDSRNAYAVNPGEFQCVPANMIMSGLGKLLKRALIDA